MITIGGRYRHVADGSDLWEPISVSEPKRRFKTDDSKSQAAMEYLVGRREYPRPGATIHRAPALIRCRWTRAGIHRRWACDPPDDLFDSFVAAHKQLLRLCGSLWAVMKNQQLVGRERQFGVRPTFVVREFDFVGAIQELHDGSDLATQETVRGHVREKSHDIEQARCGVHCCRLTLQSSSSVEEKFRRGARSKCS